MITELVINNFGKFTGNRFPLSPVTVFLGRNEAGKTTLFDALFYALCRPRATTRNGRLIRERYGDTLDVAVLPPATEKVFDEDEFLNLYAIRSGELILDLATDTAWMEKVKTRLFTGGVDPLKLKKRFDELASPRGSLKHNKIRLKLEKENTTLKHKLKELHGRRSACLERENTAAMTRNGLEALYREITEKAKALQTLEEQLEIKKKIREQAMCTSLLSRINQAGTRTRQLEEMMVFKQAETEQLDRLQQQADRTGRQLDLKREKLKSAQASYHTTEEKILRHQTECKRSQAAAGRAAEFINGINVFAAGIPQKKMTTWNKLLLLAAPFPLLIFILLIFFFTSPVIRILLPVTGLLFSLLLVILSRKITIITDDGAVDEYIKQLKDNWQNRGNSPLKSATLNGITAELQDIQRKADLMAEKLHEYEEEKIHQHNSITRLNSEIRDLQHNVEKDEAALTRWYAEHQVSGRDQYLRRLMEYNSLQKEHRVWLEEAESLFTRYRVPDVPALEVYLSGRMKELQALALPPEEIPDFELRQLEKQAAVMQQALTGLRQKHSSLSTETAKESGRLSGSLGHISQEIVTIEQQIQENQSGIDKLNRRRNAAVLARDIFDTIARDSESVMMELSRELTGQFGQVVPELRDVEIPELNTDSILVTDKTGVKRPIGHLSRGTRDAFLLAARLSLSGRSRDGDGMLILDEPFYALDRQRIRTSLDMLRQFQGQSGWQLILLTKDEELAAAMEDKFDKITVHRL